MSEAVKLEPGWGLPGCSRRAHYFARDSAISLCGKILYMGDRMHPDDIGGVHKGQDCSECVKRRKAAVQNVRSE